MERFWFRRSQRPRLAFIGHDTFPPRDQDLSSLVGIEGRNFENRSFDYFSAKLYHDRTLVTLEATLLSWRNSFYLDIVGEKGSLRVDCLCKWGLLLLQNGEG